MAKKRSIGLTIVGVYCILSGLAGFVLALFLMLKKPLFFVYFVYTMLYGLVVSFTGIGILRLKSWARIMALVLIAIQCIQGSVRSIRDINKMREYGAPNFAINMSLFMLVIIVGIGISIIYYLTRPSVKEQFKVNLPSEPSDDAV